MNGAVLLVPSIIWWGKRAGTYSHYQQKNGYIRGLVINGKRGGLGRGTFRHKQPKENQGGVGRKARRTRR